MEVKIELALFCTVISMYSYSIFRSHQAFQKSDFFNLSEFEKFIWRSDNPGSLVLSSLTVIYKIIEIGAIACIWYKMSFLLALTIGLSSMILGTLLLAIFQSFIQPAVIVYLAYIAIPPLLGWVYSLIFSAKQPLLLWILASSIGFGLLVGVLIGFSTWRFRRSSLHR